MTPWAWLTVCVLSQAPAAERLEGEHRGLQARLYAERAAVLALRERESGLLDQLDEAETRARTLDQAAVRLEQQTAALDPPLRALERIEALSAESVAAQGRALSPRLYTWYRLNRSRRWSWLLSARDFTQLLRRAKDLRVLLLRDLDALAALESTFQAHQGVRRELERLRALERAQLNALRAEREAAALWRTELATLRQRLVDEAGAREGVLRGLAAAEQALSEKLTALHRAQGREGGLGDARGRLPRPVAGTVEVGFGTVLNPRSNTVTVQKGLDLRAPKGTDVKAVAAGVVAYASWLKGYGNLVIVDHGAGYHSLMAHLDRVEVAPGAVVEVGQRLGTVGDTGSLKGAYLYFELRHQGEAVDPGPWLAR